MSLFKCVQTYFSPIAKQYWKDNIPVSFRCIYSLKHLKTTGVVYMCIHIQSLNLSADACISVQMTDFRECRTFMNIDYYEMK